MAGTFYSLIHLVRLSSGSGRALWRRGTQLAGRGLPRGDLLSRGGDWRVYSYRPLLVRSRALCRTPVTLSRPESPSYRGDHPPCTAPLPSLSVVWAAEGYFAIRAGSQAAL
ncbi:hypothetical protein AB205_0101110 [Aquarana catesbeiana]|uniref:Uncharacterized protein n=1 Tax=Aquarana catesbeiana TaxID=8400 RepID=A0A2G9QF57_AQUCT|nr:hypothetical protein AB205_0101110 [Aquarana catesbeiana]